MLTRLVHVVWLFSQLTVTPVSGDPDMYVSRRTQRPSAQDNERASLAFGADEIL